MDLLNYLKGRADQAEVMELRNEKTLVEYEANQLKNCSVAETKGLAVRLIREGRQGFAASTDADATDRLAAAAIDATNYGDSVAYSFAAPAKGPGLRTFDPAVEGLSIERLVGIGREALDIVLASDPELRCNITISRGLVETAIANHRGLDARFKASPFSMGVEISRIEGDDVLIMYDMLGATIWDEDYLGFVRRLAGKLELAKRLATIEPGRMPVLFSPTGSLALLSPVGAGLNGKEVYKGTSPLARRLGEAILDPKLSVVDDGTIDGRFGSAPFDDEGSPRRRNALIENGCLKSFIYDLKTASQAGVESTGNASRGLFNPPEPGFSNIEIEAGGTALADMIAGMDEGIVVEGVLGLGQGNIISGAFSNPLALAYKVEKGEIVGRVKDLSIAGNVYELLRDVAAVSREREWVYGGYHLPSILIEGMNVAGKEK